MDMLQELHRELQTLIKELPPFKASGFSVINVEDMEDQTEHQNQYPAAGVMYDGAFPSERNVVTPANAYSGGAILIEPQFSIIIAVQYGFAGQGGDTKWDAFSLMDSARKKILGYQKANSRPWRWVGEKPENNIGATGFALYSQMWRTYVPVTGNANNV